MTMKHSTNFQSADAIISHLKSVAKPRSRYALVPGEIVLGVSTADIRRLGRSIGVNHKLALQLWNSACHEARLLAILVADRDRPHPSC